MPTIAITAISHKVVSRVGGTAITLTGTFPINVALRVWMGPSGTSSDPPAYGGSGLGYTAYSPDGVTLQVASPPVDVVGNFSVTVNRADLAETVVAADMGKFVERALLGKGFFIRASNPPWMDVGQKTPDLEARE